MLPTNTHTILPTLAMLTSHDTLPGVSKKTGDPVTVTFSRAAVLALVALRGDGSAQTWPSRPIRAGSAEPDPAPPPT